MSKEAITVYLAGPITGLDWEGATDWREWVERKLGKAAICKSPMRLKDGLKEVTEFAPHGYDDSIVSTSDAIFRRDVWDVRNCDVVLGNLAGAEIASVGTMIEYGIGWQAGKYILTVLPPEEREHPGTPREPGVERTLKNPHDHAFVEQTSSVIVPSLHEAVRIIKAL